MDGYAQLQATCILGGEDKGGANGASGIRAGSLTFDIDEFVLENDDSRRWLVEDRAVERGGGAPHGAAAEKDLRLEVELVDGQLRAPHKSN